MSVGAGSAAAPAVSVVLATSAAATVRRTLGDYRAQTCAARIEVVVVAPPEELAQVAPGGAPELGRLLRVAADEPFHLASARARGVLAASAPWIFVGETHSYPAPTMMERLLAAAAASPGGERPRCLVPAIDNVNPSGPTSSASLLIDYGAWGPGHVDGDSLAPPIYNALFDRATVVGRRGDDLVRALSPHDDAVFPLPPADIADARFVAEAIVGHLNVERLGDLARTKYWLGLAIGDCRAQRWGWPRRLAYVAASPLIAAVLLRRYLAVTRTVRRARRLPAGIVPRLVLGAVVRAAGEARGYLGLKPEWVESRLEHLEIHKADYVTGWSS